MEKMKKMLPSSHINVVDIDKYESIMIMMQNTSIESHSVKILNGVNKINVTNERRVLHGLQNHLNEQHRSIIVMVKEMEPTYTEMMIIEYHKDKQFLIKEVLNV